MGYDPALWSVSRPDLFHPETSHKLQIIKRPAMRFNQWKEWFLQNQNHFSDIEWNDWRLLSNPERRLIKSSIQQFQRGENSEGKHLFNYAKTMGDDSYTETIRLFIKEEQTHARVLGVYMQKRGIPRITDHWVDNVFRALRQLAGLRVTLTVLLTAEIIAKTYYKALFLATDDQLLREICGQILQDEDKHIEFQCYTLRILFEKRPRWHGMANKWFHEILIRGTLTVVWFGHRKIYRAGNFSLLGFWQANMSIFNDCRKSISTKATSESTRLSVLNTRFRIPDTR